jgi:peptidoglycan/xylan/chitin deacetylase (PgdA/CDA1 family)
MGGAVAGAGGSAAGMGGNGSAGMPYGGFAPVMPVGTDLGAITVEKVAVWKGDTKGAYTIIHDDICDYNIDSLFDVAEPELSKRNLPSAFGAIVQRCQERKLWSKLETLRQHGHEIINHSWDHKDVVEEAPPLETEIDQATQTLDANLVGQKTSFFIFPYDSFNDAALQRLSTLGYVGARAGKKGVNAADFPDGMRVMFDVYGGENSIYDGQGDILQIYVDLAISQGGWSVREFHGVADSTFWAMAVPEYQQHLDYVKSKVDAGELWVDTPSQVVRYRFARQYCGLPAVDTYQVNFAQPSADCGRFATPLTVLLTTAQDAPSALAVQNGKMVKTKKISPSHFAIDIDPWQGPVAIGGGT